MIKHQVQEKLFLWQDNFIRILCKIKKKKDCKKFLDDIMTLKEVEIISGRLWVAQLLEPGKFSYKQINKITGVSNATIIRVAYWMKNGNSGYQKTSTFLNEK